MHNHSIFSDGLLSPTQLIELAARTGVDAIALTDHDTTDGLEEAGIAAQRTGVTLVPGVEISASWGDTTLHVVGLQVDPAASVLADGLRSIREGRFGRGSVSPRHSRFWDSRGRWREPTGWRRTRRC